jgi:prephenate dehydrogenase
LIAELDEHIREPAIVTDTGSTKRDIVSAAAALPPRFTFVGGHPLAGAAQGGLEHARPDLFAGRPWLLTPAFARGNRDGAPAGHPRPDDVRAADEAQAIDKLTAFVAALGAEPRIVAPADHDRILAFLSHLPQFTASALMQVVGDAVGQGGLSLSGRGLADTTRLAMSPADIWRDIAATNADQIGPALDALIDVLKRLRADLRDGERLEEVFEDAARWRANIRK